MAGPGIPGPSDVATDNQQGERPGQPAVRAQIVGGLVGLLACAIAAVLMARPLAMNASIAGQAWFGAAPSDMLGPALMRLVGWAAVVGATGWIAYRGALAILKGQ